MNDRKFVISETLRLLLGQVVCLLLMYGVFWLMDLWDTKVLVGGIVGALASVANFFVMAVTALLAADKAVAQDVRGGQGLVKASFAGRMVVLFIILFAFAKSGLCNVVALVLPLAFVRPVLTLGEFFRKKGDS